MPSLKEQFAASPRELAGSRNANRTGYQQDWALCHLLDLHDTRDQYVLVNEWHDDVDQTFKMLCKTISAASGNART